MSNPRGIKQLCLERVGQIKRADIEFGDLTVLVGKQATGKTLFLELLKLALDRGHIQAELKKHGFDWNADLGLFWDTFLGEGMRGVWSKNSRMSINGREDVTGMNLVRRGRLAKRRAFYIPAQRALTLANGWPRPFQAYGVQDPYVVREFSEQFRILMEKDFGRGGHLFPRTNRLKNTYYDLLREHVFGGHSLRIDTQGTQRRLVLSAEKDDPAISFMAWSAGQRESVPLLMGLNWLLPGSSVPRRDDLEWVIIEEPEMGLHPAATSSVLLMVFDLLSRGYRVCLSTHSPHVLDVVWALRLLQEHDPDPDRLLEVFRCDKVPYMRTVARKAMKVRARVYFFNSDTEIAQDISELDPSSEDYNEAGWGGLTEFSGHVSEVVASLT